MRCTPIFIETRPLKMIACVPGLINDVVRGTVWTKYEHNSIGVARGGEGAVVPGGTLFGGATLSVGGATWVSNTFGFSNEVRIAISSFQDNNLPILAFS